AQDKFYLSGLRGVNFLLILRAVENCKIGPKFVIRARFVVAPVEGALRKTRQIEVCWTSRGADRLLRNPCLRSTTKTQLRLPAISHHNHQGRWPAADSKGGT